MKLRIVGTDQLFDVQNDLGLALFTIGDGKIEAVPTEKIHRQYNPQTRWSVVRFSNEKGESALGLKGYCESCKGVVSASGPTVHKTVFMTHCGVAKDRPPKHIVDQYENALPKTPVEAAVERTVEKVKKVFAL
jgi:hypothetical protein